MSTAQQLEQVAPFMFRCPGCGRSYGKGKGRHGLARHVCPPWPVVLEQLAAARRMAGEQWERARRAEAQIAELLAAAELADQLLVDSRATAQRVQRELDERRAPLPGRVLGAVRSLFQREPRPARARSQAHEHCQVCDLGAPDCEYCPLGRAEEAREAST